MSSESPSESETTETPPKPQKQVEKKSGNTGTGASVELSGSDALSSSSDSSGDYSDGKKEKPVKKQAQPERNVQNSKGHYELSGSDALSSSSDSSGYPSESENSEPVTDTRKSSKKSPVAAIELSGSDALSPSSSEGCSDPGEPSQARKRSNNDQTASQTASAPAPSEQSPQSLLDALKSDAAMWPQFCALSAGFGMTPEQFENYLGMVQENTYNNAELRADICAKTAGEAERNPALMQQLLTMAAVQQVLNPVNILQFLVQNSSNSSPQPGVPTQRPLSEGTTVAKETEKGPSRRPVEKEKKKTTAEIIQETWEEYIKPTIRPHMMADASRMSDIVFHEIPFCKHGYSWGGQIHLMKNIDFWSHVFMENGDLGLSDIDILNYRLKQEMEVPDLDAIKKNSKIVKFKPTFLGMKKSLRKLCVRCTQEFNRLILLPPASAAKPILARISFTWGCCRDLYMIGQNTCIKAKDGALFLYGMGSSKEIFVSGVRFLSNVFPSSRDWRTIANPRECEFGCVVFENCTFDEPLVAQSDVFLIDCKGKELTILDRLVARCIRCEFDVVHIVGGLLVAKECRIGRMERHLTSRDMNERKFEMLQPGGETKEVVLPAAHFAGDIGSFYVLDRCTVGEDVKIDGEKDLFKYGSAYTNPWTTNESSAKVRMALEKEMRATGWHGISEPDTHILRTVKVCAKCYAKDMCIACGETFGPGHYEGTISLCQYCMPHCFRLPLGEWWQNLGDCVCMQCAICGQLNSPGDQELCFPGRLCSKCSRHFDSYHCLICGKAHGDKI